MSNPAALFMSEVEEMSYVSLVLGIEIHEPHATPRQMRHWHRSKNYGFIRYTLYASRRFSPILRETIVLLHTKQNNEGAGFFLVQ